MTPSLRRPALHVLGAGGLLVAGAVPAVARASAPSPQANWTGAIRCELQALAPGYAHQEIQTWTLTGAPTVQGALSVYPATWSVTGQGWLDRTRYTSRRVTQWTVNDPGSASPGRGTVGFQIHPVGGEFTVALRHAQLTSQGGYTGPDQFIQDGVPQATTRLVGTLYEWQFPKIIAPTTQTQLTGSRTTAVAAFVGPLQPSDAQATVTCAWALGRGSAPALPPSTLTLAAGPAGIAQSTSQSTQAVSGPASVQVTTASPGTGILAAPTSTGTQSTARAAFSRVLSGAIIGGATASAGSAASGGGVSRAMPPSPAICTSTSGTTMASISTPQRSTTSSAPTSQTTLTPACVTVAQRLDDLETFLTDAEQALLSSLSSQLAAIASQNSKTGVAPTALCKQIIADFDAAVASLMQTIQTAYAALIAAAPTAAEKAAASKAQAGVTAQLQAWRNSVVASINKSCQ